jgi:hypothetical protein
MSGIIMGIISIDYWTGFFPAFCTFGGWKNSKSQFVVKNLTGVPLHFVFLSHFN